MCAIAAQMTYSANKKADNLIFGYSLKNWWREICLTLVLAWPIILSNISQMLIHATDVFLLGRVGPDALAASAIGVGIISVPLVFGMGLIAASSPLISQEKGRKSHSVRDVRRTVRASLWTSIIFALPVMIPLWFVGDIMRAAGQSERLSQDTQIFVRAFEFAILPALLAYSLRLFITALHRPMWGLIINTLSVGFNATINYGLIFGNFGLPQLGLFGAGIGSALTSIFTFIAMVMVVSFDKKIRRYRVLGRFWRNDFSRLKQMWQIGLPIGLHWGFEVSVFAAAVFLMGYINTESVAAHSIAIQIAAITFMVPMGLSQAATIRVGNAFGARDNVGVGIAGWAAFVVSIGFMTLTAILMWIYPKQLASLFIEEHVQSAALVITLAIGFMKIAAIFQIADGAQVVMGGMLRGLNDTKIPMVYAGIGYWIFGIGIGTFLAFYIKLEGRGIWIGLASGLAIVAVLLINRWINRAQIGLLRA